METWLLSLFYPSILLTSGLQCRTLEIGADRFKVPDIMFNPSIVQVTCAKSRKLISTNVLIMLLRFKLIVSQKTFSFKFSPIFVVVEITRQFLEWRITQTCFILFEVYHTWYEYILYLYNPNPL